MTSETTEIKNKIMVQEQIYHMDLNVRNKGSNYPLMSHRKRNTETDIKQSLPYGTAPGIEC